MKNLKKRSLATFLAFCMILTMVPTVAFAEEDPSVTVTASYTPTDGSAVTGQESVTVTDEEVITLSITGTKSQTTTDSTLTIELPYGVDLVSAPGISGISADGETPSYQATYSDSGYTTYFGSSPEATAKWERNAQLTATYGTVYTASGTLTYNLQGVSGFSFEMKVKVNSQYVPLGVDGESQTFSLGDVKVTLNEDTKPSDTVAIKADVQAPKLAFSSLTVREYASDSLDALGNNYIKTTLVEDNVDTVKLSVSFFINDPFSSVNTSQIADAPSFNLTVPAGSDVKPTNEDNHTVAQDTSETDPDTDIWEITLVGNNFNFGTDHMITRDDFVIVTLPEGSVDYVDDTTTTFDFTVSDLEVKMHNVFDGDSFEQVTYKPIADDPATESTSIDVIKFDPTYSVSSNTTTNRVKQYNNYYFEAEGDAYTDYWEATGLEQTLMAFYRDFTTDSNATTEGSISVTPVTMSFNAATKVPMYPDNDGEKDTEVYLDVVTRVNFNVPFIGTGAPRQSSELLALTIKTETYSLSEDDVYQTPTIKTYTFTEDEIKYFMDAIDGTAITIGSYNFSTGLDVGAQDSTTTGNENLVKYAFTSGKTPTFFIQAPTGESIVGIEAKFSGDTDSYVSTSTAASTYGYKVYGYPKSPELTYTYVDDNSINSGLKSDYTYTITQENVNEAIMTYTCGFLWEAPVTFNLTVSDTTPSSTIYMYNNAVANYAMGIDNSSQGVFGYQNLGSISVVNGTGALPKETIVATAEIDTTGDVVKEIYFPYSNSYSEVKKITYTLVGDSTEHETTTGYSIVSNTSGIYYGVLTAPEGESFASFSVEIEGWTTTETSSVFELHGYLADSDEAGDDTADAHKLSIKTETTRALALEDETEETPDATITAVDTTFTTNDTSYAAVRILGTTATRIDTITEETANVLTPGVPTDLEFMLFGGKTNDPYNTQWHDIVFTVVLPDTITLNSISVGDFQLEHYKGTSSVSYYDTGETASSAVNINGVDNDIALTNVASYFTEKYGTVTGATAYQFKLSDEDVTLYWTRWYNTASSADKGNYDTRTNLTVTMNVTADLQATDLAVAWEDVLILGTSDSQVENFYVSDSYIGATYEGSVATQKTEDGNTTKYADFQTGVTNDVVVGPSDTYIFINQEAMVMVQDAYIEMDGEYYHYVEDDEDTVATFTRDDSGTLHFSIIDTVSNDISGTSYVLMPLPTVMSTNALQTTAGFAVTIDDVAITPESSSEDGSTLTYSWKYVTIDDTTLTSASIKALTEVTSGYNAILIEIEKQAQFSTLDVAIDFTVPTNKTTSTQYVEFSGMTSYYFEANSQKLYYGGYVENQDSANNYVRFAYSYQGHTITFNNNYSDSTTSETYAWGDSFTFADPEPRTGYTFLGWSTEVNGEVLTTTNEASEVVPLTSGTYNDETLTFADLTVYAHTLYAQWSEGTYSITLDADGGTVTPTEVTGILWTDNIPELPTPTKLGYTFNGWKYDGEFVTAGEKFNVVFADANETAPALTADWTENTYTLTLKYQDDTTPVSTATYGWDDPIALGDNPTRTGYTFKGWYTKTSGGTKIETGVAYNTINADIATDQILYAQWEENTYTITLNYTEGSLTVASPTTTTVTVKWTDTFTLPSVDPDNSAYHLANWQCPVEGRSAVILPNEGTFGEIFGSLLGANQTELTINANYDENIVTVNYYIPFDGDTALENPDTLWATFTYVATDTMNMSYPSKDGYTFRGWYEEAAYTNVITDEKTYQEVFDDHTHGAVNDIYAKYTANEYDVTYNLNGGSGENVTQEDYTWVDTIAFPTAPTRDGYTFTGWFRTKAEDNTLSNQITAGQSYGTTFGSTDTTTQTVYAGWSQNTYTVKFDLNDGTGTANTVPGVTWEEEITLPTDITRTGYDFGGWTVVSGSDLAYDATITTYAATGGEDVNGATATLYAIWTAKEFTPNYDVNSGEGTVTGSEMAWDATFTFPADPERTSYQFSGWFTEATCTNEVTSSMTYGQAAKNDTGTLTLYAKWTAGAYTVSYDVTDISSVKMNYEEAINLTSVIPEKEGCTFVGWYYDETQVTSSTYYNSLVGSSSTYTIVLNAHWIVNTPTATVDYANEELTGLEAGETYTINDTEYTADEDGKIALATTGDDTYDLFGTTISIVYPSTGTNVANSVAQTIALVARPEVPTSSLDATVEYTGAQVYTLDCDTDNVTIHYDILEHNGSDADHPLVEGGDYDSAITYAIKETSDLEIYAVIAVGYPGAGLKSASETYAYTITPNVTVGHGDDVTDDTIMIATIDGSEVDAYGWIADSSFENFGLIKLDDTVDDTDEATLKSVMPTSYSMVSDFHLHATVNDEIVLDTVDLTTEVSVDIELGSSYASGKTYQVLHMKHDGDSSDDVEFFSEALGNMSVNSETGTLTLTGITSLSPFMVVAKSNSNGSSNVTTSGSGTSTTTEVESTATLNTDDHIAYMNGYLDGSFGMDKSITRAETIVMFSRLMTEAMDMDATYTSSFTDVSADLWYANYVGFMEEYGILTGYLDGTFRGDEPITRAEFATVASRFDELIASTTGSAFYDVDDTHWAIDYINSAAEHGWVSGYLDGSFKPDQSITRAEAVTVVNHMLGRNCDEDFVTTYADEIVSFIDLTTAHWAYWDIMEATNAHDYTMDDDGVETWTALK